MAYCRERIDLTVLYAKIDRKIEKFIPCKVVGLMAGEFTSKLSHMIAKGTSTSNKF